MHKSIEGIAVKGGEKILKNSNGELCLLITISVNQITTMLFVVVAAFLTR